MTYRLTKRTPARRCIDISEGWKLRYWSDVLGVSKTALRRAVDKVGARAEDVERELYARQALGIGVRSAFRSAGRRGGR